MFASAECSNDSRPRTPCTGADEGIKGIFIRTRLHFSTIDHTRIADDDSPLNIDDPALNKDTGGVVSPSTLRSPGAAALLCRRKLPGSHMNRPRPGETAGEAGRGASAAGASSLPAAFASATSASESDASLDLRSDARCEARCWRPSRLLAPFERRRITTTALLAARNLASASRFSALASSSFEKSSFFALRAWQM